MAFGFGMFPQEQRGEVRRVEMWLHGGNGAASLQPSGSRSLPPPWWEGGGGPHTRRGATWSYQADGWKEVEDRVGGVRGRQRQQQHVREK